MKEQLVVAYYNNVNILYIKSEYLGVGLPLWFKNVKKDENFIKGGNETGKECMEY